MIFGVLLLRAMAVDINCLLPLYDVSTCYMQSIAPIVLNKTDQLNFILPFSVDFKNIKMITLDQNSKFTTPVLPPDILQKFPNLEILEFPANLSALSKTDFINERSLVKIDLSQGHIEIIPSGVFSTSANLTLLKFDINDIHTIEKGAFEGLLKLKTLSLSNNRLRKIDRFTFANLAALELLYLDHNLIEEFEEGALKIPELKYLYLSHNKLKALPDSLFALLPQLSTLTADHNNIEQVNNGLYLLQKLEWLQLGHNNIKDLDIKQLAKLPALEHIFLANSGFNLDFVTILVSEIASTKSKVIMLDLSDNNMKNGAVFEKLKIFFNISEVDLSKNKLVRMDLESIRGDGLSNLKKVTITGNPLDRHWLNETMQNLSMELENDNTIKITPQLNIKKIFELVSTADLFTGF